MRILWFTESASLYDQGKNHYHGAGWIESLEALVKVHNEIELGICFFHKTDFKMLKTDATIYYPILRNSRNKNPLKKLIDNWNSKVEVENLDDNVGKVISNFQPDLIQVFGTEGAFSRVQEFTHIPVVYHIQGLINPCLNTYFPINQSKFSFHLNTIYLKNTFKGNSPAFDYIRFKNQASRERKILKNAKYLMGRTHWDKMIVKLYNPNVHYFHVNEVLRPVFYNKEFAFKQQNNKQLMIVSSISPTIYKGIDVILKSASKLKELTDLDFEWQIIGLDENAPLLKHFEKTEGINHKKVNVFCRGRKSPEEIIVFLKSSDVYVHPSYIDNSPNSLCEAQMMGLPVIACNVGGVGTFIEHQMTGFLVPANGVFEITSLIKKLFENKDLKISIGNNAKRAAEKRHDKQHIVQELMNVYRSILGESSVSNEKKDKNSLTPK